MGGEGGDGEDVGGFEGAGEQQAGRMLDVDHDAAFGARVALAEIVRHVGDEGEFILDLFSGVSRSCLRRPHARNNIQ